MTLDEFITKISTDVKQAAVESNVELLTKTLYALKEAYQSAQTQPKRFVQENRITEASSGLIRYYEINNGDQFEFLVLDLEKTGIKTASLIAEFTKRAEKIMGNAETGGCYSKNNEVFYVHSIANVVGICVAPEKKLSPAVL
jgi:hypothetical protein